MSRRVIPVNRSELANAIKKAEANGPLQNLNCLWKQAASFYNDDYAIPNELDIITFSVVALRVKEFSIPYITVAGKKGRVGGVPRTGEIKRVPRSEKFKNDPVAAQAFQDMKNKTPKSFVDLADKIIDTGSMKLAIKMNCLQCTNYQRAEIRDCDITRCVMWNFRPFQGKSTDGDIPDGPDEDLTIDSDDAA